MTTYLIQEGPNPTADFYFPDRDLQHDLLLGSSPSQHAISAKDTLIFIRYINKTWLNYLKKLNEKQRPHLVFFIDDDVFDYRMHVGLPWRYRYKLYCFAASHQKQLKKMGFTLWVSTPWLLQKYQQWQPVLRPPQNPYVNYFISNKPIVFYHGSASHCEELKWLLPVVESVLINNEDVVFEFIGTKKIKKIFSHLPQVHVYHPMAWASYRELLSKPGRTIGLAPLLDNAFNHARSFTKFFDITYAGAVGIYADTDVYRHKIIHQQNGLLLPMNSDLWAKEILGLLENKELHQKILLNARNSVSVDVK